MPKQQWQPVPEGLYGILGDLYVDYGNGANCIAVYADEDLGYIGSDLPESYRLCQLVDVDTPQPMEMPDGPGWWAYEDDRDKFVAHLQIFTCADGGVDFKFDNSGRAIISSERFRAMYPGKWYRIVLPWE